MNLFEKLKTNKSIPPFLRKKGIFVVDDIMGVALLTTLSYNQDHDNYLIVTSNLYKAQKLYNSLASLLPNEEILLFPADELVRVEAMAQSKEMSAQRLYVLDEILNNRAKIVIANLSSAVRFLPNPELFKSRTLNFRVGESHDFGKLKIELAKNGYTHVSKVDQSLQFAFRGDILDIYSVNNDYPIRIEFFGDEIESIRYFDLATQTSIKKIDKVTILPASDLLLSEKESLEATDKLFDILEKDKEIVDINTFERIRNTIDDMIPYIIEGQMNEKHYKYYSLLSTYPHSIFDYCKNYTKILVNEESLESSNDILFKESHNYLADLFEAGKAISHLEIYQDLHNLINERSPKTIVTSNLIKSSSDINFGVKGVPYTANKSQDIVNIVESYLNDKFQVVINLQLQHRILY